MNDEKEVSKTVSWALKELQMIEAQCEDEDELLMQKHMTDNVMEVIEVFSEQGHSGFSAAYAIGLITRLLKHLPLLPLTGEDDEWDDVDDDTNDEHVQQNIRCGTVFRKNFDNSTASFIEGKVFSDDGGDSWYTSGDSNIPIVFPFVVPAEPEYVLLPTEETEKGE